MIRIYPYNQFSESAKLLAEALDCWIIKREGSKYRPKFGDKIINWGCTRLPINILGTADVFNEPFAVENATNKLSALSIMKETGVSVPDFTTTKELAEGWINEGIQVCARATLTGKEGEGLTIHSTLPIPTVPLYTKYVKKKNEYRIHVFGNRVIDMQEKKKRAGVEERDTRIRNTANGYVFCRQGIQVPQCCQDEAVKAVQALGLDFGGVDVVYNKYHDKAYVLEINTAPGFEGTTVEKYKEAFTNEMLHL